MRLNPDVRDAVESGHIESGFAHYVTHGHAEGRPLPDISREVRNAMLVSPATAQIETLAVQACCSVNRPMTCIRIIAPGWRVVIDVSRLMRVRRTDVEQALGTSTQRSYGFFWFRSVRSGWGRHGIAQFADRRPIDERPWGKCDCGSGMKWIRILEGSVSSFALPESDDAAAAR